MQAAVLTTSPCGIGDLDTANVKSLDLLKKQNNNESGEQCSGVLVRMGPSQTATSTCIPYPPHGGSFLVLGRSFCFMEIMKLQITRLRNLRITEV